MQQLRRAGNMGLAAGREVEIPRAGRGRSAHVEQGERVCVGCEMWRNVESWLGWVATGMESRGLGDSLEEVLRKEGVMGRV